jgi:hypothetical protein
MYKDSYFAHNILHRFYQYRDGNKNILEGFRAT